MLDAAIDLMIGVAPDSSSLLPLKLCCFSFLTVLSLTCILSPFKGLRGVIYFVGRCCGISVDPLIWVWGLGLSTSCDSIFRWTSLMVDSLVYRRFTIIASSSLIPNVVPFLVVLECLTSLMPFLGLQHDKYVVKLGV